MPSPDALRFLALVAALLLPQFAHAQTPLTGAAIVQYHRFGEDDIPATNIKIVQFEAHVAELTSGKYAVMALPGVVEWLRTGHALPDRAVTVTIDDPFLSVYAQAWPRLKAAGIPFTVFLHTDVLDAGRGGRNMTWAQVKEMAAAGVTMGLSGAVPQHYPEKSREAIAADVAKSVAAFTRELGVAPALFAYPFGEMSLPAREVVRAAGFTAAFGQHSGVAEAGLDPFFLPRFALNETFGTLERFVLDVNTLPFGARDIEPADPVVRTNRPVLVFSIDAAVGRLSPLNCFASHENTAAQVTQVGERRFEVRANTPMPLGRGRISCTMAAGQNRFRWFGEQLFVVQ